MNRLTFILILIAILLSDSQSEIMAQCCGAGNPVSNAQGDALMKKGHVQIALGYRHSKSDKYYEGSHVNSINFPGRINSSGYDFLDLNVSYGVTKRLTLGANLGYFIDKTENYKTSNFPDIRSSGFGDVGIRASYTVYRHARHGIEVAPFIMVKLPIGKFDCESDGIKLPLAMQPSSGSFKYSLGVYGTYSINRLFYLTTFDQFEYSQRIKSKFFDYRYGELWNLNVGLGVRVLKYLHAALEVGYEAKGKAHEDGIVLEGSQYQLLKLTPHLTGFYKNFQLSAGVELPVWRKVGGIQMSNLWALQLTLAYNIKL